MHVIICQPSVISCTLCAMHVLFISELNENKSRDGHPGDDHASVIAIVHPGSIGDHEMTSVRNDGSAVLLCFERPTKKAHRNRIEGWRSPMESHISADRIHCCHAQAPSHPPTGFKGLRPLTSIPGSDKRKDFLR